MTKSDHRRVGLAPQIAALGLFVSALTAPVHAEDAEAWRRVASARDSLAAASPLATSFVQSFTPSGFTMAEEESGTLAIRLTGTEPLDECVRWDYEDPFPKGFLLCGHIAWTWNPGDASGRRQLIGRADSFGLDLLRLSVDELRESYEAHTGESRDGRLRVRLEPIGAAANEIRDAELEIDGATGRLTALSYHDVEGNLTRFALGDFESVPDPDSRFVPPPELAWLDQ